jgi:hypothetical protein
MSLMSLTDLAKYAVRQAVAKRAAQSDTNLLSLLKHLLPSLLYTVCTEYLEYEPDVEISENYKLIILLLT